MPPSVTPLSQHLASCRYTHAQTEVTNLSLPDCGHGTTIVYRIDLGRYSTQMGHSLPPGNHSDYTGCYRLMPGLYALPYRSAEELRQRLQLVALVRQDGTPLHTTSALQWLQDAAPGQFEPIEMLRDAEQRQQAHGDHQSAIYGVPYEPTRLVEAVKRSLDDAFYRGDLVVDRTLPGSLFALRGNRLAGACGAR